MTFATAVPISFTSFVYRTNVHWSVIHGIKRKPHLSVVWNWYHFVAIAILHQPRPTDSADINTRLQLSDTSSIPPMHGGFLLWPWKSKVKVIAQGHKVGITPHRLISLSLHVNGPSHSWDTAISKFYNQNSRSRSWVRSKLKVTIWVQHSVDSHPFRSMSIRHPIPASPLFQNLTLKIKGQGHGWGHSSKSQCGSNILSTHIPFVPCQSVIPFLRYRIFKIWPWISRVKVKWPWCCTSTGLDNSIGLWMV